MQNIALTVDTDLILHFHQILQLQPLTPANFSARLILVGNLHHSII